MTYNLNTKNKAETLVNIKNHNQIDNKIVFAFSFFNGYSIKLNDFNNYYFNNLDATKAVSDFFKTIKDISRFNSNNFYLPAIKTQLHYNEFKDSKIIA